ncbi:hypothetical protein ACFV06_00555 [Streptomyces sp. NPDC059618]|uniref:hypothetical protein n=1 Tax=Streptomyces sp. NPDC059618 TaxID=3346887 RepID=UPI0036BD6F2C
MSTDVSRSGVDTHAPDRGRDTVPKKSADREPDYAQVIGELVALRERSLDRLPSDRALASLCGHSPTTVGNWLRNIQFPQSFEPLLMIVRAVASQARAAGLDRQPAAASVLDEQLWRRAYAAEAQRRADGTRVSVQAEQSRAVLERLRPGRPLSEVTDPFQLEVHHSIDSSRANQALLPTYVRRTHDDALADAVTQAAAGASKIAVLVGGSSTGKTRACWEALNLLRAQTQPWKLWHPIDPSRPAAVLAELTNLAPYTVVWLNEAQDYLAHDGLGEQVAAGLRTLLTDPKRRPVVILATLWPDHWSALTTRGTPDRHAQARQLLNGHKIRLPETFTAAELTALNQQARLDPRLAEAARHATNGQITQYLAGGPVLRDRYEEAPPATRRLIDVAMDARRFGAGPRIPLDWLAAAAPGYLTENEWEITSDDWLQKAIMYCTYSDGGPAILTAVRTTTPRNQRIRPHSPGLPDATGGTQQPLYRLADYLVQYGRRHRAEEIPPVGFWSAAAVHAHPDDLTALGHAAVARGLYRDAAQLYKRATTHGSPNAAIGLVSLFRSLPPVDHSAAPHAVARVALNDPRAVGWLLNQLRGFGTEEGPFVDLAWRAAATCSLDSPGAVAHLLDRMAVFGTEDGPYAVLAQRAASDCVLQDHDGVDRLLGLLQRFGTDQGPFVLLAGRAAKEIPVQETHAMTDVLRRLRVFGTQQGPFVELARRAAIETDHNNPRDVARMLDRLRELGAHNQAAVLAECTASRISLHESGGTAQLLRRLKEPDTRNGPFVVLAERVAADSPLKSPGNVAIILDALRSLGMEEGPFLVLAERAAAGSPPKSPSAVVELLDRLRVFGTREGPFVTLAERVSAECALDDPAPHAVASLLSMLRTFGTEKGPFRALAERAVLSSPLEAPGVPWLLETLREEFGPQGGPFLELARRVAVSTSLDDPRILGALLGSLNALGAHAQFKTLAERAAAGTALYNTAAVTDLLTRLRVLGAHHQFMVLAQRAAADCALDDPAAVAALIDLIAEEVGVEGGLPTMLAERAAVGIALGDHGAVAKLLDRLRILGTRTGPFVTLAENAATRSPLGGGFAVTDLLKIMREIGVAHGPFRTLALRLATDISVINPYVVDRLLSQLQEPESRSQLVFLAKRAAIGVSFRDSFEANLVLARFSEAGLEESSKTLVARLPGTGHFDMFIHLTGGRKRFAFGREPDGEAAAPWTWAELA